MRMSFSDVCWSECPALFVGGQLRNESPVAEIAGKGELLGIEFRPTGFYRLFKKECSAFTDCISDFYEIDSSAADALFEALSAKRDIPAKVSALEHFIEHFVRGAEQTPRVDHAVDLIERHQGYLRVADLADRCHWSPKQLHRHFLTTVGVGPKHFAKIVQINRVAAEIQAQNREGLQSIAGRCGYYDQAHFIHDFQRFIGTNPLAFLRDPDPFLKTYLGRVGTPDRGARPAPGKL